jgi:hypothetical protein
MDAIATSGGWDLEGGRELKERRKKMEKFGCKKEQ